MQRLRTAKDRIGAYRKARIGSGRLPIDIIVGWLVIIALATAGVVGEQHANRAPDSQKRAELQQALNKAVREGWAGNRTIQLTHDTTPLTCSGYKTRQSITYGVQYKTTGNVCVGRYSGNVWEAVERDLCYRDGVAFGSGDGGCRWTGTIQVQANTTTNYYTIMSNDWCNTCGGEFIQDSGRQWSGHVDVKATWGLGQGDAVRGLASAGVVRYKFRDGTISAAYNTVTQASPGIILTS